MQELVLFFLFIALYGTLAINIAYNYTIVFDNRIPWDAYFSFDNRAIVMTGGGFERHPLANYFFGWMREIAFWFSDGKRDVNFRLVLAIFSAFAISLTMLQIFKYLKNIIRLPNWLSWAIVLFFSLFSTNILLSFTPETYTYTLLFLTMFNYYAALKLRKDEKISASTLTLATVTVGGLTTTNAAKVFIPVLVEKGLFRSFKKFGNAVLRGIVAVTVFVLLYLNRLNFDYQRILDKMNEQYDKFSDFEKVPVWDMISSWFLGGSVLFSSFHMLDYHNPKGYPYKALFMDVYQSWIPYAFVAVLLGLVFWSYFKNLKNKLVQVLMFSFLFDVFIHCVLKFGLKASYIYGGHFVFVYPLLIGWLFYSYRDSKGMVTFLLSLFLLLFAYLGMNNFIRMQEFYDFLNAFYK